MITAERLRELLDYDPLTGQFRWLIQRQCVRAGSVAGSVGRRGYRTIGVERKTYRANRLAWFHFYGIWPTYEIDHINRVKDDNRIANLRDSTGGENSQNVVSPRSDNTSGYRGVTVSGNRWRAQIAVGGKNIHLGQFDTPEEAARAYQVAKERLHPSAYTA